MEISFDLTNEDVHDERKLINQICLFKNKS